MREQAQSAFERAQSEKAKESKEADPNKAAAAALRMSMSLDGIEGQKQEKRKAPAGDDDEDVCGKMLLFIPWVDDMIGHVIAIIHPRVTAGYLNVRHARSSLF